MRDNYDKFKAAGVKVVAVANDDLEDVQEYFTENKIPFTCIPDEEAKVGGLYQQQSKFGLMPAVFVVDQGGIIQLAHFGTGMADIPSAQALLAAIAKF